MLGGKDTAGLTDAHSFPTVQTPATANDTIKFSFGNGSSLVCDIFTMINRET